MNSYDKFANLAAREHRERRRIRDAALAWLERELGWQDHDLPKGLRGEAQACPIANALTLTGRGGAVVQMEYISYTEPSGVIRYRATPDEIQSFMRWFDGGEYPDLEIGGKGGDA